MSKYLITNAKKGTYNLENPLGPTNLVQVGKATDILMGDYLPLSGGEMAGNIFFPHPSLGVFFGDETENSYIKNDVSLSGMELGSKDLFNFYNSVTNELAVEISSTRKVINSINGFEWDGQSLDDRYDKYISWNLLIDDVQSHVVTSDSSVNIKGVGATSVSDGGDGVINITSQNYYADSLTFNDSDGNIKLSGNGTDPLITTIKTYDHRVHGLGTTNTINGIGRNKKDGNPITSFNDFYQTGFHTADVSTAYTDGPYPQSGASRGAIMNFNSHNTGLTQLFSNREKNELWFRDSYNGWSNWVEIHHTGNLKNLSDLNNDLDMATSVHAHHWNQITNKPSFYGGWRLGMGDGSFLTVSDNDPVTFQATGGTSISRTGNVITIGSAVPDEADGNNYATGIEFNEQNGDLKLNRLGLTSVSTNFDGRYSLISHTHTQYEPTFTKNTAFNRNFGLGSNEVLMGEKYVEWLVGTLSGNTTLTIPNEVRPMGYYLATTSTDFIVTLDKNNALNHFKIFNQGDATISVGGTTSSNHTTSIQVANDAVGKISPGGTGFISFVSYKKIDGKDVYSWNLSGDLEGLETYAAGTALTLTNKRFDVDLGTGATQAAAGNHTHNYENPLTFTGTGTTSVSRNGNNIVINSTGGEVGNDTQYSAGTALTLSGTKFNVNLGSGGHQAAPGNHSHNYENPLSFIGAGNASVSRSGNVVTITASGGDGGGGSIYTAGTALTLSGNQFNVSLGSGSNQAAPGNHTHNYEKPLFFMGGGGTTVTRDSNNVVRITSTGGGDGGTGVSDGNNYPTSLSYTSGVLTLGIEGLPSLREGLLDDAITSSGSSRILNTSDNGKTLIFSTTTIVTVPTGLPNNFSCNFINDGSSSTVITFIGNGITLKSPNGNKLLFGYTCNVMKRTGTSIFYLHGELS